MLRRAAIGTLALAACARVGFGGPPAGDHPLEARVPDAAFADLAADLQARDLTARDQMTDLDLCACKVSGTCYAAGQVSAGNPCERCEPDRSMTSLSLFAGKGCVTTLAGTGSAGLVDGPLAQASFARPHGITVAGGTIYVADQDNAAIRMISGGQVTTLFGKLGLGFADGPFATAKLQKPLGAALSGGVLYVADASNDRIRAADLNMQIVSTAAGSVDGYLDGAAAAARFKLLHDIAAVGTAIYVADETAHAIRRLEGGQVSTIAGNGTSGFADGVGDGVRFSHPTGLDASSTAILVADSGNCRIRRIRLDDPQHPTSTVAGGSTCGNQDGPVASARFDDPHDVVEVAGVIYVAGGTSNRVRRIANGQVTTLIGDGTAGSKDGPVASATISNPTGIAAGAGGAIYIAEMDAHRIRVYTP